MKTTVAIMLVAQLAAGAASAQSYYEQGPREGRRYERVERGPYGYEGGPRYRQERGPDYGYRQDEGRRGYGQRGHGSQDRDRFERPSYGASPAYDGRSYRAAPGPSIDEQKRMIKNHREAQKKAIKRGYVIP